MSAVVKEDLSGVQPWDSEVIFINDAFNRPGGQYLAEVALLDYAYLTDIAAPIRLAKSPNITDDLRRRYLSHYHQLLEEHEGLLDDVRTEATVLAGLIPETEHAETLSLAKELIYKFPGHTAVIAFVDFLESED